MRGSEVMFCTPTPCHYHQERRWPRVGGNFTFLTSVWERGLTETVICHTSQILSYLCFLMTPHCQHLKQALKYPAAVFLDETKIIKTHFIQSSWIDMELLQNFYEVTEKLHNCGYGTSGFKNRVSYLMGFYFLWCHPYIVKFSIFFFSHWAEK